MFATYSTYKEKRIVINIMLASKQDACKALSQRI